MIRPWPNVFLIKHEDICSTFLFVPIYFGDSKTRLLSTRAAAYPFAFLFIPRITISLSLSLLSRVRLSSILIGNAVSLRHVGKVYEDRSREETEIIYLVALSKLNGFSRSRSIVRPMGGSELRGVLRRKWKSESAGIDNHPSFLFPTIDLSELFQRRAIPRK